MSDEMKRNAQRILAIEIDPILRARIEELASKANEGLLLSQEREEYAALIEAGDLLAILKAKARRIISS